MTVETSDELRRRVVHGLGWKIASQVFRQGWRIAVALILARLLSPRDYGLAAMVLVFSTIVLVFADVALGAALVQRRELTDADRSTVFWTSAGIGVVCTLVGIACSWPLAAFYGEPAVQPLFAALSVSFIVTSLGTTQSALLNRDLNFKSLELRLMVGAAVGGVAGVMLALSGYGPWAIIGQQLVVALVSTVLLWVFSPWRPSLTYSRASLRRLGGFSLNVFGTRLLFYLNRNADNLLIGRFVGAAALGAYALAYNVMLAPMSRVAAPIQELLFPAFARMQDDVRRMASIWLRANRLVAAVTVPMMLGLIAVAPEFVSVVLGERWRSAEPVIRILAWVGLLQSLQRLNSSVLQARDRTGTLLKYGFVVLGASLVAFAGGLHWGIVGVATAYAISSTLVEPYYMWLTARTLGVPAVDVVRSLAGVFQASIGMLICVLATKAFLLPDELGPGARLALLVGIGVAAYVLLCAWRARDAVAELRAVRGDVRRSRGTVAPVG